jgi:hypothetical protein
MEARTERAWFQASAVNYMRTGFFWVVTHSSLRNNPEERSCHVQYVPNLLTRNKYSTCQICGWCSSSGRQTEWNSKSYETECFRLKLSEQSVRCAAQNLAAKMPSMRETRTEAVNCVPDYWHSNINRGEHAVAQLVEALRYKTEGRGFDSRWSHWNFSLT